MAKLITTSISPELRLELEMVERNLAGDAEKFPTRLALDQRHLVYSPYSVRGSIFICLLLSRGPYAQFQDILRTEGIRIDGTGFEEHALRNAPGHLHWLMQPGHYNDRRLLFVQALLALPEVAP